GGSWSEAEESAFKQPTIDMFEEQGHPLFASARLWDDGIIDPRETRRVLGLGLAASYNKKMDEYNQGIFRM
ncbi:methylcrotonoyl-CoA carboxylase, partial [bacterium]|nr:methylcrotonoyl-CoA carboxylase [bacterium]